ncbi:MAG: APC family permease, partial [Acidobacteria bacterium]|nr:APC family permease [Acidobacteriota bacterium]
PAKNVFDATVISAQHLNSSRLVCGLSNKLSADEQAKLTGDAWERLPEPRPRLTLDIIAPDGTVKSYELGPHMPRLRPEDVDLLHKLWLDLSSDPRFGGSLHHYHVLALALEELKKQLRDGHRDEIVQDLQQEMSPDQHPIEHRRDEPN